MTDSKQLYHHTKKREVRSSSSQASASLNGYVAEDRIPFISRERGISSSIAPSIPSGSSTNYENIRIANNNNNNSASETNGGNFFFKSVAKEDDSSANNLKNMLKIPNINPNRNHCDLKKPSRVKHSKGHPSSVSASSSTVQIGRTAQQSSCSQSMAQTKIILNEYLNMHSDLLFSINNNTNSNSNNNNNNNTRTISTNNFQGQQIQEGIKSNSFYTSNGNTLVRGNNNNPNNLSKGDKISTNFDLVALSVSVPTETVLKKGSQKAGLSALRSNNNYLNEYSVENGSRKTNLTPTNSCLNIQIAAGGQQNQGMRISKLRSFTPNLRSHRDGIVSALTHRGEDSEEQKQGQQSFRSNSNSRDNLRLRNKARSFHSNNQKSNVQKSDSAALEVVATRLEKESRQHEDKFSFKINQNPEKGVDFGFSGEFVSFRINEGGGRRTPSSKQRGSSVLRQRQEYKLNQIKQIYVKTSEKRCKSTGRQIQIQGSSEIISQAIQDNQKNIAEKDPSLTSSSSQFRKGDVGTADILNMEAFNLFKKKGKQQQNSTAPTDSALSDIRSPGRGIQLSYQTQTAEGAGLNNKNVASFRLSNKFKEIKDNIESTFKNKLEKSEIIPFGGGAQQQLDIKKNNSDSSNQSQLSVNDLIKMNIIKKVQEQTQFKENNQKNQNAPIIEKSKQKLILDQTISKPLDGEKKDPTELNSKSKPPSLSSTGIQQDHTQLQQPEFKENHPPDQSYVQVPKYWKIQSKQQEIIKSIQEEVAQKLSSADQNNNPDDSKKDIIHKRFYVPSTENQKNQLEPSLDQIKSQQVKIKRKGPNSNSSNQKQLSSSEIKQEDEGLIRIIPKNPLENQLRKSLDQLLKNEQQQNIISQQQTEIIDKGKKVTNKSSDKLLQSQKIKVETAAISRNKLARENSQDEQSSSRKQILKKNASSFTLLKMERNVQPPEDENSLSKIENSVQNDPNISTFTKTKDSKIVLPAGDVAQEIQENKQNEVERVPMKNENLIALLKSNDDEDSQNPPTINDMLIPNSQTEPIKTEKKQKNKKALVDKSASKNAKQNSKTCQNDAKTDNNLVENDYKSGYQITEKEGDRDVIVNLDKSDANVQKNNPQKKKVKTNLKPREVLNKNLVQVERYPIYEMEGEQFLTTHENEAAKGEIVTCPRISPEEMLEIHIGRNRSTLVKINTRPHVIKQDLEKILKGTSIFHANQKIPKNFEIYEEIKVDPRSCELAFGRESYLLDSQPKVRYFRIYNQDIRQISVLVKYALDPYCDSSIVKEWNLMQRFPLTKATQDNILPLVSKEQADNSLIKPVNYSSSRNRRDTSSDKNTGLHREQITNPKNNIEQRENPKGRYDCHNQFLNPNLNLVDKPAVYEQRHFEYSYFLEMENFYPMDSILMRRFKERKKYLEEDILFIAASLIECLSGLHAENISLSYVQVDNVVFCPSSNAYKFLNLTKAIEKYQSDQEVEGKISQFLLSQVAKIYYAPEMVEFYSNPNSIKELDRFAVDLYSLGVTLLCLKFQLIASNRTPNTIQKNISLCKQDSQALSSRLITQLLECNPQKRVSNVSSIRDSLVGHLQSEEEAPDAGIQLSWGEGGTAHAIIQQPSEIIQASHLIGKIYKETFQWEMAANKFLANLDVMKSQCSKVSERDILRTVNEIWQCLTLNSELEDALHYNEVFFNNINAFQEEETSLAYDHLLSGKLKWKLNLKVESSHDFDVALLFSESFPLLKAKTLIVLGDFFSQDSEISAEQYFRDALNILKNIHSLHNQPHHHIHHHPVTTLLSFINNFSRRLSSSNFNFKVKPIIYLCLRKKNKLNNLQSNEPSRLAQTFNNIKIQLN